ncbi:MAG: histidine kinase [Zoogloeaceae bacterium]|nr:histidine kinase [Zoogloeaceae bacterium]
MSSIRQKPAHPLPDWRNFGILLRILVGANFLSFCVALVSANSLRHVLGTFVENAAWVELLLLFNLSLFALIRDPLWRCPPRIAQGIVLLIVASSAALLQDCLHFLALTDESTPWRAALLAAIGAGWILGYFDLRAQTLSPRLEEARLSALNSRIRPHFFFNALNTVLALIRSDPRGAESMLEGLSDLFRAILKDSRRLSPLSEEIALGRQYLAVEKLRLGERLKVNWEIGALPEDILVPPLMLQPLLENAVYHGIEPLEDGEIHVRLDMVGELLRIEIENSVGEAPGKHPGNQMALDNIRQRLALFYDMEASLEHSARQGRYQVRIDLPCRRQNHSIFD